MKIIISSSRNIQTYFTILFVISILCFSGCKKENPKPQNEGSELTTQEIYYNIKMLSVGLHGANNIVNSRSKSSKTNATSLTDIIYKECAKGMDGFYFSSYNRIAEAAEAENINLTELMNLAISDAYGLPNSVDYAGDLINGEETYYAFVPFLKDISGAPENETGYLDVDETTLAGLTNEPLIGYMHLESNYPIPGVEVDDEMYVEQIEIDKADALQRLVVTTVASGPMIECDLYRAWGCNPNTDDVFPDPHLKELRLCQASNPMCEYCGDNPYQATDIPNLPPHQVNANGAMHSEIYIYLDYR